MEAEKGVVPVKTRQAIQEWMTDEILSLMEESMETDTWSLTEKSEETAIRGKKKG